MNRRNSKVKSISTTRLRILLIGLLVMSLSGIAFVQRLNAQVLYGSVGGTVTDQSGAALPGAQIKITNDQTGFTRQATTNSAGAYRIIDLPEGTYTIDASASGFKPLKETGVRVVIGQVNGQDVQMQVGAVTQEVTVQGSTTVLQTQKTDVHTTISSYAVQNLPLNIYHNFQSLELLAPGVVSISPFTNAYPNSIADAPDRSFAINSNGLPQHINTSRVDGATNIFLWLPDHMVIVPPAATVQEVNVQTATYGVQKGLTAGAATDVVTKSGTNEIHGSLYAFHSDQAIDAQPTLLHLAKKPQNIQNNDGFTIGGPIKKDKMFFFANWDGYFQRQAFVDTNLIPPTDTRTGNFTSYLGSPLFDASGNPINVCTTEGGTTQLQKGMVFDPTTGNTATGQNRCVFSSGGVVNMIPASRMYGGALNFWKLLPAPNQPGPFTATTARNSIIARPQAWNRNIYTGKVDYNISDRQALWGKYTLQKARLNDPSDYGVAGQGSGTGVTDDTAQTVTLGHTWTKSSNMVLSGHVGFTRMGENNKLPDFGQELGQSVLGLVNSDTPLADKRYSGMSGIGMGGFTTLGTSQSWEPVFRNDWTVTLNENATWIHGNHEFSFGFDAAHNHMNHWQPEIVCCPRGFVQASADNTFLNLPSDPTNPASTTATVYTCAAATAGCKTGLSSNPWNSVAEFDLGLASTVQNGQQYIKATNKDWQEGLYIGDRWRVTPKLTADFGVRWEYYPLITRDGVDKFELYDPTTNTLKLGGVGGNSTHLGVTSSKTNFAPRIGLAYRLNDNTVVRSSFGITFDTLPLERALRGFYPLTIGASNFVTGNSNVTRFLPYATFNAANNTANAIPGLAEGVQLITAPPSFASGAITPPGNVTIGTLAPGTFKRGYVESWNLTVERRLPSNILLSVAYVGNHLVHQFNGQELNAAAINTGSAGEPLFAAFKRTADTYAFQGYLDSHYNSLQVALNRHVTNGLFLQGSYTYSKVIGYMDDEGWENGLFFQCPGCQALNRHTLSFDHTHVLKMAYVYQLPFGAGKKWANSDRVARAVLGNWQTNGVFTAYTGAPLQLAASNFLNAPFSSNTPNFTGSLQMARQTGPGQFWFAPTSFTPVVTPGIIGNTNRGLSWMRGPGLKQLDFSVFRNFAIKERYNLEMRFEALNLTNTPHWFNPSTFCSNNAGTCGGSFGQITSAFGQRIVQIGAQIRF
ncbi:MAG TPA: TonB-dependent receptor [Terriglobia bacterium]|nr:TonB-dependent receptor [Terriglobia bacterium]